MKKYSLLPGQNIDDGLKKVIGVARKRTQKRKDDFFLLSVGLTGSGKSMLSLHVYEEFNPSIRDDPEHSIRFVTLDKDDFINGLDLINKKKGLKFLCYDEASIMSSDALTKWNKALVKLYMRIRSKRIFHWWSNPSPRIDKILMQEKINGVIFIYTKRSPRRYYYLTRRRVLKLLDKTRSDKLTLPLLDLYAKKYALFCGCFRDYQGPLRPLYELKKDSASDQAIEDIKEEFGSERLIANTTFARKHIGINQSTLDKRMQRLIDDGFIIEGRDFFVDQLGRRKWSIKAVENVVEGIKATSIVF